MELPETLSACSDEDLLVRFCRGEAEAFGVLVRRYERELYGYLRRYLGDGSLAEDVFQNTFVQLYVKSGQYEAGRPRAGAGGNGRPEGVSEGLSLKDIRLIKELANRIGVTRFRELVEVLCQ